MKYGQMKSHVRGILEIALSHSITIIRMTLFLIINETFSKDEPIFLALIDSIVRVSSSPPAKLLILKQNNLIPDSTFTLINSLFP